MQDVNLVLADRYQVRERLGGGAGAEEYLGRDLRLDRPVVIQVIRGAGQDGFAPQARLMASLDHPAVASVYDWGQQHGMAYLIREFVPGEDLARLLRQHGTLPVTEAAAVGAEVAAALAAAHRIGLAHGNLDPAEVIVGEQRVTVVGFGAAWMRDQATGGGDDGDGDGSAADLQRDLRSLGAVLYQTVTGSAPAPGPAMPTVGTSVPAPLRQVIARLLARDPVDRYQSAEAVRADLLHLTREPIEPVPARPTDATAPRLAARGGRGLRRLEDSRGLGGAGWRTRRRWLAALLGLALLGVAVGVAIVLSRQ